MIKYWPFLAVVIIAVAVVFALYAGTQGTSEMQPPPQPDPGQLANPASVNCINNGYESEIRTAEDGSQTGYCIFPDGSECEEWAFFRGECGP